MPQVIHVRTVFVAAVLAMLISVYGCARAGGLRTTPHEAYAAALRDAGIDQTALGRDWVRAGVRSIETPLAITTPFQETGYLPPDEASAVAYRMELQRGRRLAVEITFTSSDPGRLFVDLFRVAPGEEPRVVAALPAGQTQLTYEVERDGTYLLRVQPELLRGGQFTILQRTLASLRFPVPGQTAETVQSLFGAERDAGIRQHEGIDIFVPRGTPAVAVTAGIARTGVNDLGGNVVWLADLTGSRTFYYAHLDRWAFEGMKSVREGDVLGYVGNTGNARSTPPHLHFGIYDAGAVNPLPYVRPDEPLPALSAVQSQALGELLRTTPARATLRAGPSDTQEPVAQLERHTLARVHGASREWLRVVLPDGSAGYLPSSRLTSVEPPLRRKRVTAAAPLLERPSESAPVIEILEKGMEVAILGQFNEFEAVRAASERTGWVAARRAGRP